MADADCRRIMLPHKVCGISVPGPFDPKNVLSAIRYRPRADDLFLATFPKCGTTWTQQILVLLFRDGQPPTSMPQLMSYVPFFEVTGSKAAEDMQRPGAIKIHLPFALAPWSDEAKYICVTRNPKDCCVSYFYHEKGHGTDESFDDFFEKFMTGETNFGDYFDHLMGWYEQRNKPNVFFITYEYMKENPREAILKIASFIDDEKYAKPLRENHEKINDILKYSSFNYMKESFQNMDDVKFDRKDEGDVSQGIQEELSKIFDKVEKLEMKRPRMSNLIRKGVVGDWRNHFSEDQNKRMNERFESKTKGTDLFKLWEAYL